MAAIIERDRVSVAAARRSHQAALGLVAGLKAMSDHDLLRFVCGLVEKASRGPSVSDYPTPVARAREIFVSHCRQRSRCKKTHRG